MTTPSIGAAGRSAAGTRAIRIVPLRVPHPVAGPPPQRALLPALTYRGGALLSAVEVFTIFWGSSWQQVSLGATIQTLDAFFKTILTSTLIDQLAEYAVPNYPIGHGRFIGSTIIGSESPPARLDDAAVQQFLHASISAGGAVPAPTPNTLYFIYLPPGVTVTIQREASCAQLCGYHDATNRTIFYAVMPYPGCSGCAGDIGLIDALTSTSSHELCEAITDPVPGTGWYDDANGEVGDICAWQTKKLGSYTVQLEWSNQAGACR
jgi:hypothetical protein